ncbi:hypothetical protein [Microbacterium sp. H1-D42]|uniref:hypothetical protein n=1 Tax=Microbacterium sp. H1-D42 TaxID=2925844 RepID=UPI001F536598|nr:hypothetical protein [Microbacterium sp. H1-D42]UNK69906.1 hypothetical protein MNR00_12110 [Microbacterium sp. H1-D42]
MTDLADAVARAVLTEAGVEDAASDSAADVASGLDADAHLAVITASAHAEQLAAGMLHRAVIAARGAGVSWARIGERLGMSRQAAQQRFGGQGDVVDSDTERWLGPVTAFDEMAELALAGREGWHTVEAGMLAHRMLRTDTRWEHRRTLWRGPSAREVESGWQIGCRAFPWIYLVRDIGIPVADSAD